MFTYQSSPFNFGKIECQPLVKRKKSYKNTNMNNCVYSIILSRSTKEIKYA